MEKKILNKSSGKFEKEFACMYSNTRPLANRTVTGYKLAIAYGTNYYSLVSGLFRYKLGPVDTLSNYQVLYKDTPYAYPDMIGRVAVFKSMKDLDNFYPEWREFKSVVALQVSVTDDLIAINAERNGVECELIAGKNIKRLLRHE